MDLDKILKKILPIAGITGAAYAIGFLIHTAHFRMLGVKISLLDPVKLIEIAGEFVVDSVRILILGYKDWLYLIIALLVLFLWYWAAKKELKGFHFEKENGTRVQGEIEKWILVVTLIVLVGWIFAFVLPMIYLENLLMTPDDISHPRIGWSYGWNLLHNLKFSNIEELRNLYRLHLYILATSILILGNSQLRKKYEKETSRSEDREWFDLRNIPKVWPRYVYYSVFALWILHFFLLPVAYGVIAKEPAFPNVKVLIDPDKTNVDDIFGLNFSLKTGEVYYLIHRDSENSYVYNIRTRIVTMLKNSSIYDIEFIPQHGSKSILQYVYRPTSQSLQ